VIGEPRAAGPAATVEHHPQEHVDAAAELAEALAESEALKAEEAKKAAAAAAKAEEAEAAAKAELDEEARVAQRIADMKLKQEEERKKREEEESTLKWQRLRLADQGFMGLKKLLVERGVPKEQVFGAANKYALIAVAKNWAETIKIEWEDAEPAPEPTPAPEAPPDISDTAEPAQAAAPEKAPSPEYKPMSLKERMAAFQKG